MDVDLIGCVGVRLGGTYGCRCGILYAHMLGVVFHAGLVSLTKTNQSRIKYIGACKIPHLQP